MKSAPKKVIFLTQNEINKTKNLPNTTNKEIP